MDRHQHAIVRDAKCRKSGSHSDYGWVCQKLRQPTGQCGTNLRSKECDALFYAETSPSNQPAGQAVCGVRPLVRFRSIGRLQAWPRRHCGQGLALCSGRSPDWLKRKNPPAPAVKREEEEDWRVLGDVGTVA